MRETMTALVLASALAGAPSTAEACLGGCYGVSFSSSDFSLGFGGGWEGASVVLLSVGAAAVGLVDMALIFEGIEKATHGHGMFRAGAMVEVLLGLAQLGAGAVAMGFGADGGEAALLGGGAAFGVAGAYLFAHGIWSLTDGRPIRRDVSVSLTPSSTGMTVLASGSF